MVSGGFDPVHVGHIRMIREAAEYGDVIVVANSDNWLHRKKGFVFMEFEKRAEILSSIKGVILVDSVDDTDGTVCEAIRRHKPTILQMVVIVENLIPPSKMCVKKLASSCFGVLEEITKPMHLRHLLIASEKTKKMKKFHRLERKLNIQEGNRAASPRAD